MDEDYRCAAGAGASTAQPASSADEKSTLLLLAERCRTEGADWKLDDAIAQAALGHPPCGTAGPRPYTSSIDAAALLMPPGFRWSVTSGGTAFAHWPGLDRCENCFAKTPPWRSAVPR